MAGPFLPFADSMGGPCLAGTVEEAACHFSSLHDVAGVICLTLTSQTPAQTAECGSGSSFLSREGKDAIV